MSDGVPPVVTWALVVTGAWLVYASVRGLQPLAELRATLTGSTPPAPSGPILANVVGLDGGTGDDAVPPIVQGPTPGETAPPSLVKIGQGNHSLAPDAALAFAAWQKAFGRTITITDSYRSYTSQAAGYASDPKRFAPPGKSYHVKGRAVDVNLQALGAAPDGPTWKALYAAATATGWCNPRGPYKGDHAEPWHFSFGGCG